MPTHSMGSPFCLPSCEFRHCCAPHPENVTPFCQETKLLSASKPGIGRSSPRSQYLLLSFLNLFLGRRWLDFPRLFRDLHFQDAFQDVPLASASGGFSGHGPPSLTERTRAFGFSGAGEIFTQASHSQHLAF